MSESEPSRRISIYLALGAGSVADVLLWKKQCGAILVLVSATAFWFLFERAGYNILSFAANVMLLLAVIIFLWAKSASLLNRPLPPLPDLRINEDSIMKAAVEIRLWINPALSIARDITVGILISMSIPVLYDKYQDHVDDKWLVTRKILRTYHRKLDDNIRMKIPIPLNKEKKLQ